jgi:hypothetical protein
MNAATLLKALLGLVPASMLFSGSFILFRRRRTISSFLQILGAGCVVVVVLTHIFEALRVFSWMRWGGDNSVGHYVDLSSALLALALFPAGYLLYAVSDRKA